MEALLSLLRVSKHKVGYTDCINPLCLAFYTVLVADTSHGAGLWVLFDVFLKYFFHSFDFLKIRSVFQCGAQSVPVSSCIRSAKGSAYR